MAFSVVSIGRNDSAYDRTEPLQSSSRYFILNTVV